MVSNLAFGVLGIVTGFVLGELLEELNKKMFKVNTKIVKVIGAVIVAILNFTDTLIKYFPQTSDYFAWGIFLGVLISTPVELSPAPIKWCVNCIKKIK